MTSLKKLLRPGRWTITDSVIRNAILYVYLGVGGTLIRLLSAFIRFEA